MQWLLRAPTRHPAHEYLVGAIQLRWRSADDQVNNHVSELLPPPAPREVIVNVAPPRQEPPPLTPLQASDGRLVVNGRLAHRGTLPSQTPQPPWGPTPSPWRCRRRSGSAVRSASRLAPSKQNRRMASARLRLTNCAAWWTQSSARRRKALQPPIQTRRPSTVRRPCDASWRR